METQWQVVMLGKFDDEVFRFEHVFQALLLVKWHLFATMLPKILMNPHKFLLKLEIDFFGTNYSGAPIYQPFVFHLQLDFIQNVL